MNNTICRVPSYISIPKIFKTSGSRNSDCRHLEQPEAEEQIETLANAAVLEAPLDIVADVLNRACVEAVFHDSNQLCVARLIPSLRESLHPSATGSLTVSVKTATIAPARRSV
ncbi:MAG: hypothetical protein JOY64_09805 [Alphaproteobacteria bacterium]|nr:hypothetical protein [Alphaproteobacteria bacterium]